MTRTNMNKIKLPEAQDNPMWDVWMSMYHLSILTVADELTLFVQLRKKHLSLIELAEALNLSSRTVEILAEPLVCLGFLDKNDNKFSLTSNV